MEENNISTATIENNKMDTQLVDLLKQLSQVQAQITAIVSTRFEKETTGNVNDCVENKQNFVSEEAKRYGQNPSIAQNAIAEYANALEQVRNQYATEKNLWLAQSGENQIKEIRYIMEIVKLKEQLAEVKNKVDLTEEGRQAEENKYKTNILSKEEELQIARECEDEALENVTDCKERCSETLNDISQDKELVESDSKNIFQKIFSKIMSRFNGKEKFNNNVIESLKNKAEYIKQEVVPKVKEKIEQTVMPKLKEMFEKGKEKVSELGLKDKFSNLMDVAKVGAKFIVEKGMGVKGKAISLFVAGIPLIKEGITNIAEKIADSKDDLESR